MIEMGYHLEEKMFPSSRYRNKAARLRLQRPKNQFNGFEGMGAGLGSHKLFGESFSDGFPCSTLESLYARMGLHRYNFLNGTNLQFRSVEKYYYTALMAHPIYYITLVAMDPSTSPPSIIGFHTEIENHSLAQLSLVCHTARPRGANKSQASGYFTRPNLPEWPQENPFENNTDRFYLLKESELQDKDWIRLYLELAIAASHRNTRHHDFSNLEIVKVAIETTTQENRPLNAINATVYISYKDSCEERVGKDVDRIAMVRRNFSGQTRFALLGQNQSSETIIPKLMVKEAEEDKKVKRRISLQRCTYNDKDKLAEEEDNDKEKILEAATKEASKKHENEAGVKQSTRHLFMRRLGVYKPWRLSNPRRLLKAHNNNKSGFGSTRRLGKTRSV